MERPKPSRAEVKHLQFLEERPIMRRDPVYITERIGHEVDELYEEVVDEPNLWEWGAIAGEVADIYLFLLCVANNYGINLEEEALKKIERNRERFPASEFQTGSFDEAYRQAKIREGRPVATPIDVYNPSVSTFDTLID